MSRGTFLLLIAVLVVAAGCGREPRSREGTISRERFIDANVALRQVDLTDPQVDSLREAVLAEEGVTEADLRAFIEARGERPLELSEIWSEIHRKLTETPPVPIPGSPETDEPLDPDVQREDERLWELRPHTPLDDSLRQLRRRVVPPPPTLRVR